jgi:phospholipid/cholesterol/gamma-HCH transport system permease protein
MILENVGHDALSVVGGVGDFALFGIRMVRSIPQARGLFPRSLRAVHEMGIRCLPVIGVVGLFTGLVLGLEGYHTLARLGSESVLGSLVVLSLVRELGPVLAALMIVGQSGSALAAELGIQRNSEQIDVLGTMGIDALGFLAAPRLIASIVTYPILTLAFNVAGMIGGAVSGCLVMGLDVGVYQTSVRGALGASDLTECLVKSVVFGLLTVALCLHQGYTAHRRTGVSGTRAVSVSTTRAVVLACIAVLFVDALVTSAFL